MRVWPVARYLDLAYREDGTWGLGHGFAFRSASARDDDEGAAGQGAGAATRPLAPAELSVLIGWCAVVQGQLQAQRVPVGLAGRLRARLVGAGLLPGYCRAGRRTGSSGRRSSSQRPQPPAAPRCRGVRGAAAVSAGRTGGGVAAGGRWPRSRRRWRVTGRVA